MQDVAVPEGEATVADAAMVRSSFSWPSWAAATAVCLGVALALGRADIARALGFAGPATAAVRCILFTWPLTYAGAVAFRERVLPQPVLRASVLLHGIALWSACGACTSVAFGPGYALLLLLPPGWGALFPWNRTIFAGLLVVPPALRFAFVPSSTALSLVIALAVGAAVAAMFALFSFRRSHLRGSERRTLAAETLFAESIDSAADRAVALQIHDTLSGALAVARARATRGTDDRALAAGDTFLRQARVVLATLRGEGGAQDMRDALLRFAGEVGVDLVVDSEGAAAGHAEGLATLREILQEVVANHARHGKGEALALKVRTGRRQVVATWRGGHAWRADGAGRGVRNMGLRVAARGGRLERDDSTGEVRVVIPLVEEHPWLWPSLWLLEALVYLAPPVLGWLTTRSVVVTAVMTAPTVMLLAIQIRNGQSGGAAQARLRLALARLIERASGSPRSAACSTLGPHVDRLEEAVSRGDAAAVRTSLVEATSMLERLLGTLETGTRAEAL